MKYFNILFFLTLICGSLPAQNIEEDITVLYMKANVLYDSGRFDEAVRMYNRVLATNEYYAPALLMRAKAKYELGAYRGTKIDMITYIERNGVTKEVIHTMARTEFKLSNFTAAKNYVATAIELDPYDPEWYLMAGEIDESTGSTTSACEMYEKAVLLGSEKARKKHGSLCGGAIIKEKPAEEVVVDAGPRQKPSLPSPIEPILDTIQTEEVPATPPVDLTASRDLKIDENLTVTITNGLGDRKIEFAPDIFILSTEDGSVVIDVCVDQDGKVTSAEFNPAKSTLNKGSLTSLAIRKARDFIFLPSLEVEQCGSFIFNIKA